MQKISDCDPHGPFSYRVKSTRMQKRVQTCMNRAISCRRKPCKSPPWKLHHARTSAAYPLPARTALSLYFARVTKSGRDLKNKKIKTDAESEKCRASIPTGVMRVDSGHPLKSARNLGEEILASSGQRMLDVWPSVLSWVRLLKFSWDKLLSFRCWHYPEMEVAGPYVIYLIPIDDYIPQLEIAEVPLPRDFRLFTDIYGNFALMLSPKEEKDIHIW